MKKLFLLLTVLFMAVSAYSACEAEYNSVGKQFNTVVINVPASFTILKGQEHSVNIINESTEFYTYEIINDTLFIRSKFIINDVNRMKPNLLKVQLTHPNPSVLYDNIKPQGVSGIGLSKIKSGNQN